MIELTYVHWEIAKVAHHMTRKTGIKCTATPESVAIALEEMKTGKQIPQKPKAKKQRKVACNA